MIQEVYEIGRLNNNSKNSDIEDTILPDKLSNIDKVFCISFDSNFQYSDVLLYEFNQEKQNLYLMRKAASNGINFGPTSQVTEIQKTLKGKILAWFKTAIQYNENAEKIQKELQDNETDIIQKIQQLIVKKERYLITINIDGKFPYEIDWIFDIYSKMIKEKIYGTTEKLGTCYLCKNKNVPIVPEYGVYKFFTKDKPGFISGGCNQNDFWRNFPICTNCQPILNKGKQYIEEKLKHRYYGLSGVNYYIIPSNINSENELQEVLNILSTSSFKMQSLNDENKTAFEEDNEDIMFELRNIANTTSFRIVFIKKEQSAERILLDVQDIYPSRFKTLFEQKETLDRLYKDLMMVKDKEKNTKQIKFNYSFYREFLNKSDDKNKNSDLDKIFLQLTQDILNQNPIKLDSIMGHYMRRIRRLLDTQDLRCRITTLKAAMGIQYLISIGCLESRKEENMQTKFEDFFETYNCGLNTDEKRALVLIGALVQKVMNIQGHELKSTPFVKKLKSLRLREPEIKGLVPECVNKMQEYDKYSSKSQELVQEISKLIINSEPKWKLSVDEMNFYIVAGMSLQKEIYGEENKEEVNDDK